MSRLVCPACHRPLALCLCALVPRLDSRTRVLILQHPSEVRHALNTARLAALGLLNAELRVGEVFEDLPALLNQPGYRACLLFPGVGALPLPQFAEQAAGQQTLLVVPDGTWRKARKLLYCNPCWLPCRGPAWNLACSRATGCARHRKRARSRPSKPLSARWKPWRPRRNSLPCSDRSRP